MNEPNEHDICEDQPDEPERAALPGTPLAIRAQEEYALWRSRGYSAGESAKKAGYSKSRASRLDRSPKILARIRELGGLPTGPAMTAAEAIFQEAMDKLTALEDSPDIRPADKIRSIDVRARLLGLDKRPPTELPGRAHEMDQSQRRVARVAAALLGRYLEQGGSLTSPSVDVVTAASRPVADGTNGTALVPAVRTLALTGHDGAGVDAVSYDVMDRTDSGGNGDGADAQ